MIETAKKILNGKYKFGSWRIGEFLDLSVVENSGLTPEQFLADLVELFLRNCTEPGAIPVAVVMPALSGRITTRKGLCIDTDRVNGLEVGDMLYPHPSPDMHKRNKDLSDGQVDRILDQKVEDGATVRMFISGSLDKAGLANEDDRNLMYRLVIRKILSGVPA